MAAYKLFFKKSVQKDFDSISKKDLKRILSRIESLSEDPRPKGCDKLTGQERYRLRQGQYRIVYSIQDDELTVWVVKVGHRKDIYS
jgi:mRNA interferase RelE/StbE